MKSGQNLIYVNFFGSSDKCVPRFMEAYFLFLPPASLESAEFTESGFAVTKEKDGEAALCELCAL